MGSIILNKTKCWTRRLALPPLPVWSPAACCLWCEATAPLIKLSSGGQCHLTGPFPDPAASFIHKYLLPIPGIEAGFVSRQCPIMAAYRLMTVTSLINNSNGVLKRKTALFKFKVRQCVLLPAWGIFFFSGGKRVENHKQNVVTLDCPFGRPQITPMQFILSIPTPTPPPHHSY